MRSQIFFVIFFSFVLASCRIFSPDDGQDTPIPEGIIYEKDISYGPHASNRLDICRPEEGDDLPAVVLIHGGGWRRGDKTALLAECRELAMNGFVALTINYRLAPEHKWPSQMEDVQLAVRWLRANSGKYDVNKDRIASMGGSAGGHLASMAGLTETWGTDVVYPKISSKTNCVIDRFGPHNLTRGYYDSLKPENKYSELGEEIFIDLFGGITPDEDPLLYMEASPVYHISDESPSFYITHSKNDQLVPLEYGQEFADLLKEQGVETKIVPFDGKGSGHGWDSLAKAEQERLMEDQIDFLKRCLS
jgi:acetyl esterase/lipase